MGNVKFVIACGLLLRAACVDAQTITAYAGAGPGGFNGDDPAQTALTAQLNSPRGIAVDAGGNVYIADYANYRVRKVTPAGVITTVVGTGVAGPAIIPPVQLNNPSGVAVDPSGNLYIADASNHRVLKVDAGGTVTLFAGVTGSAGVGANGIAATSSRLNLPLGVATDTAGNVYIADTANHRVRKVTVPGGIVNDVAGVPSAPACSNTQLNFPVGVAVDGAGTLYIADTNNHRIMQVVGGVPSVYVGTTDVCVTGDVLGPAATARLNSPNAVAVTQAGDLLISDSNNHRIKLVRAASGNVLSIAGTGVSGDTGDNGPASAALLSAPAGIAAGPSGAYTYFVSDAIFSRIRKVTPVAPGTPTLNSLTPAIGQVTAAFTPGPNGGAPVTYTVQCTGGVTQSGSISPIVVTGLLNGALHYCTVSAASVGGSSAASNTLSATPGSAPSITSAAPPGGTVGVPYNHTYVATGVPSPAFGVTSGALPPGLGLPSGGTLVGTPTAGGTYTGTVSAINGVAPNGTQNFSITIAIGSQAISFAALPDRTMGTGPFSLSATGGGSGSPVTFSSSTTGVCTATGTNGTTLTLIAIGTCTIAANQAGNPNWNAAPQVTQSFTVSTIAQAIVFAALPDRVLGTGPFTLAATGGASGNAVTFASSTTSTCTTTGTNGTTLTLVALGTCTIAANQAGNASYDPAPQVTRSFDIAAPTRLGNISTRMQVLSGNDVLIGGFVIGGVATKRVAIVATGPSLTQYGIANALAHPTLTLVRQSPQAVIGTNDGWGNAGNAAQLLAAGFAPSNPIEAAILADLAPGAYTAIVSGAGGGTGVGIVAVYEVDHPESQLVNISTRGQVLTGADVMIGGFIIFGTTPKTVAIVGTGPSLSVFGIANPLANPTLALVRSSDQAVIATNDDWQTDANAAQLQAAGFAPSNPLEAALYVTLPPGAYTAILSGAGGGTGVGIIGVYATP